VGAAENERKWAMRNRRRSEQAVPEKPERAAWVTATPYGVDTPPGTLDSDAQRLAAQEAARCIAQVLDVTNDLVAAPFADHDCLDTGIGLAVHAALEWDVLVARAVHDL
jgi:hypothetical protein